MEITPLDQQVSVSGQITAQDIHALVEAGIELLVCNRPENESAEQTSYEKIAAEAQKSGLVVVNIPFAGGQIQPEQVEEFAELLETHQRIHAYCRTGNRSSKIWAAAKAL